MNNKNLDRLFAALQKPNFTIYGNDYQTPDGTCIRDYISINDVCRAINHLLNIPGSGVYNICTGKGTSVLEIAKLWGIEVKYGPRRKGDINISIGNNYKLRENNGEYNIENHDIFNFEIKDSIESIIASFFQK
jgi:UDP-glucose 4-epimerase